MKLRNKDTVYGVFRRHGQLETLIAVFRTYEGADNYSGVCLQEMLDKNITEFQFGVGAVIYYDE